MANKNTILTEEKRKRGEMLQALRENNGVVLLALKKVGIDRNKHDDWLKNDPDYREVYNSIQEDQIDGVKIKMLERIYGARYEVMTEHGIQVLRDAPCKASIKFYLESLAKHHGFVQRKEITGAEGGPVQIIAPDNI
jgi:hypothetical protein